MSDRDGWDPWDFGEPEPEPDEWEAEEAWDDPAVEPWEEPVPVASWGERAVDVGPPRGALLAALAVMVVLAFGIGALVVVDDDGDDEDAAEVDTDRSTTSVRRSTTSTSAATTTTEGGDGDEDGSTSTSVGRSSSTTRAGAGPAATTSTTQDELPEPGCASGGGGNAQSVPDDWATRWETRPEPNDPATISICIDDVTPRVGQRVEVTLLAKDPDAIIVQEECGYLVEWEGSPGNLCRDYLIPHQGPRPTPAEEEGYVRVTFVHVYTTPGARTIVGSVRSSRYEGYTTPYASYAEARLPVTVRP